MQVYTYSEARQKLAMILDQAENKGKVLIRRKDGRTFALVPEKIASSPLDVPTIKANITTQEIVGILREGREMFDPRCIPISKILKGKTGIKSVRGLKQPTLN